MAELSKGAERVIVDSLPALQSTGALSGVFVVNDATEKTINFKGFLVLEDTVITKLNIAGVNKVASYISTPATALKAGAYITPTKGLVFSGIQVTGSVALILG